MFVKLNFTANKTFSHVIQAFNEIINNSAITNTTTLASESSGWHANILSSLDYATSDIIRTVAPTTVKSHLGDNNSSGPRWTLEFQVHDAASRKYYIQAEYVATTSVRFYIGDTILSGSTTADMASPTVDLAVGGATSGVPVLLQTDNVSGATQYTGRSYTLDNSSPINQSNIRTAWMYLNDKCLIFAVTPTTSYSSGFPPTYSSASDYTGPYIFSQYTRYDYHNSDANGIIPLMFSNMGRAKGIGFGGGTTSSADWGRTENVNAAGTAYTGGSYGDTAFRVFNLLEAHPIVGSFGNKLRYPGVNWGSGTRHSGYSPLTTQSVTAAGTLSGTATGRLIHTGAGVRYPTSDLQGSGFAMLPLRWSNSYQGNLGGNATDQGGFYIFNGDYVPGDTIGYNSKVYMIWPTYSGYTERVGVAIPME